MDSFDHVEDSLAYSEKITPINLSEDSHLHHWEGRLLCDECTNLGVLPDCCQHTDNYIGILVSQFGDQCLENIIMFIIVILAIYHASSVHLEDFKVLHLLYQG